MKSTVVFDEFNEIDLKPSNLLRKYIQLTEKDVKDFFIKSSRLVEYVCPGCQNSKVVSSFKKFGMQYVECASCHTLYISPRPNDGDINCYYRQSEARVFWHDELSRMTTKKRKEKIIKPRFEWIVESTKEYLPQAQYIVDVNTDHYGYIEELAKNYLFSRKVLLNPFVKLDVSKYDTGIDQINVPLSEIPFKEEVDVVSLFEVADRIADVDALFDAIYNMLKEGGLCFMTNILISGFDLQTLWNEAENLYPPDRLNVFSAEGLQIMLKRHGFECCEFSTPGILDVEIIEKAHVNNAKLKLPRFIEYFIEKRSNESKRAFQEFLQSHLLSSYGRIVARKK